MLLLRAGRLQLLAIRFPSRLPLATPVPPVRLLLAAWATQSPSCAPVAGRLDIFLALHVPHGPHQSAELSKRASLLYAAHSASCAKRHGGTGNAAEALAQFAREAAAGHLGRRRVLVA